MMTLRHINLTVTDPPAAAAFLETHFGLRNEGGKPSFMLVRDGNDMVITLMKARQVAYPETFHVGFYMENPAEVDALHARLASEGIPVQGPFRDHGYSIYIDAPGGFTIEVTS